MDAGSVSGGWNPFLGVFSWVCPACLLSLGSLPPPSFVLGRIPHLRHHLLWEVSPDCPLHVGFLVPGFTSVSPTISPSPCPLPGSPSLFTTYLIPRQPHFSSSKKPSLSSLVCGMPLFLSLEVAARALCLSWWLPQRVKALGPEAQMPSGPYGESQSTRGHRPHP